MLAAGLAILGIALWDLETTVIGHTVYPIDIAFLTASVMVIIACWKGRRQRAWGYAWVVVGSLMVVAAVGAVDVTGHRASAIGAAIILVAAWSAHAMYRDITAGWGFVLLACGTTFIIACAADDYTRNGIRYHLAICLPLLLIPYVCANVRPRTAVLSSGGLLLATTSALAAFGNAAEAPGAGASEGLAIQIRAGLARLFNDVAAFLHPGRSNEPLLTEPVSTWAMVLVLVALAYFVHRCLWLSADRLREVVVIKRQTRSGKLKKTEPELEAVLTAGTVAVGAERIGPSTGQDLVVGLTSSIPGAAGLSKAAAAIIPPSFVTATVRTLDPAIGAATEDDWDPAEDAPRGQRSVALTIEHSAKSQVQQALLVEPATMQEAPNPLPALSEAVSPPAMSAYAILAYCLSARGMPAWSTYNPRGVGVAAWAEARKMRQARGNSLEGIDAETELLLDALSNFDPRALLLMLEVASRDYYRDNLAHAFSLLARAADDFPQFPETWVRLAITSYRIATRLLDGGPFDHSIRPSMGPGLNSSRLIEQLSAHRDFRKVMNAALLTQARSDAASGSGIPIGEPIRALEYSIESLLAGCAGDKAEQARADLARYFLIIARCSAQRVRWQLLRPRLMIRCAVVQSERVFFWPIMWSRFGVRRFTTTARSIEALARTRLALHETTADIDALRGDLARDHEAVTREGTGWRSALYLAEAYELLERQMEKDDAPGTCTAPGAAGSRATGADQESPAPVAGANDLIARRRAIADRTVQLRDIAARRCLAERGLQISLVDPHSDAASAPATQL